MNQQTPSRSPEPPKTGPRPLSNSETAHALQALVYTSAAMGAFSQMVGIQMAVFIGFALWAGAADANIAQFVAVASLASLAQIVSTTFLTPRIRRKKAFVICMGSLFGVFRFTVVLVPLLFASSLRVPAIGLLVGVSLLFWNLGAPFYVDWQARIIPEDIRARFLGRQNIANLLAGIAASYLAGWYLDLFPGPSVYTGFFTVFAAAALLDVFGFLNLTRVPFLQTPESGQRSNLRAPFRNRRFRRLLAFFWTWNFAWVLASPFYNVFMLKTLGIDYATVAVLNSLFMGGMVVGAKVVGGLADRYGSKAVLQILIVPSLLTPLLWTLNRPDNYYLLPVALGINGVIFAGSMVSVNALLYGIVPRGRDRTAYFAGWSCSLLLANAIAPLVGSTLVKAFASVRFTLLGYPVGSLQIVFLVSAVGMIVPNILLRAVEDRKQTTPRELIGRIGRGNLFSYLYGALVYDWTQSDRTRARATRRMGRSKSPMALDRLIRALEDASPEVRKQAARSLGEAGASEAVGRLLEEMKDEESDIRSEAVEALGKIGDARVIDSLVEALDDPDARIQISAVRALSEIGGEEAGELLFWKFAEGFDRSTFPTLADALGRARDPRMVRPTLTRLPQFRSSAIRLQLLNSVCRTLGARRRFYQLISQDALTRAERLAEFLGQTRRAFRRARFLGAELRKEALADLEAIRRAFDEDDTDLLSGAMRRLTDRLEAGIGERAVAALGEDAASRIGASILGVRTFLDLPDLTETEDVRNTFLLVCLWSIGDGLRSA